MDASPMKKHGYMNSMCGFAVDGYEQIFPPLLTTSGHGVERQSIIPHRGSRNSEEASKTRDVKSVLGWLANP